MASVLVFTASAYVAIRHLRHSFSPGSMTLGRLVVGSLVLGLILLLSRSWTAMSAREWAVTTATGLLLFGAYNLTINVGASRVDAGSAAFVNQVPGWPARSALWSACRTARAWVGKR